MFSRQFLVAHDPPTQVPTGWKRRRWAGMFLFHAPDLPVVGFEGPEGTGLLLGWPIYGGRLWADGESLRLAAGEGPPLLAPMSGRFLALVIDAGGPACYLDPCGFLPAVYSTAGRILAATSGLLPAKAEDAASLALRAAFDIPAKSHWYPFGLTGSPGIRRLLPNHRLDLLDFSVRRCWPVEVSPWKHDRPQTKGIVVGIARLLRENVAAVATLDDVVCNLTAGRDTRMILAALRDHVDRVDFTTFRLPDGWAEQDVVTARLIATRFGLRHLELACDAPVQADIEDWLTDTGHCVGGRTLQLATTGKRIAGMAKFSLSGLAGDIGRGVDWCSDDFKRSSIGVDELLERLGLRIATVVAVEQAGSAWLAGLSEGPATWILDIALIEASLACNSCASFYGNCHGGITISPFNDRRIIDLMLALPPRYRYAQRLAPDLIDLMWPELNLLLFNPATTRRRELRRQQLDILRRRTWRYITRGLRRVMN